MKKKGFTLIELLVVIAIIAMLMAILMPALSKVKKIASRVVCGTNLKGLGTAQTVYANDYDDEYVVQGAGGRHTWDNFTKDWQDPSKDWKNDDGEITVGASLYLLVREADVSPKSFVCPSSDQKEYDGKNPSNFDIVDLWDFASPTYEDNGAANCVSYSYHNPYAANGTGNSTGSKSRYAADGTRSAAFAVMADKNPWFENVKLKVLAAADAQSAQESVYKIGGATDPSETNIDDGLQKYEIEVANAQPHDRESQNVLYADGHTSNEKRSDVGVNNDNIYVQQNTTNTVISRRAGILLNSKLDRTIPENMSDTILVNDGDLAQP